MESTGVYWIPLFLTLAARGIAGHLVNARHAKNLPGRKPDIADCQWLQKLHTFGLRTGSFRPTDAICVFRSSLRQRETLRSAAATCIQHMHKALTEMNVQLANVISDISEVTGLAILHALLAGERDPGKLAALNGYRIKASPHTLAKNLEGNWRDEVLFNRRQSLELYAVYQQNIAACDARIDGIEVLTAQTLISEIGLDMSRWKIEKHFASSRSVAG